jgi:hypothetical protein
MTPPSVLSYTRTLSVVAISLLTALCAFAWNTRGRFVAF